MIKRLVYIACLGICLPFLVSAGPAHGPGEPRHKHFIAHFDSALFTAVADTTTKKQDDKKKIKEVTRAKQVPKPEKVDDNNKVKKRQRRPPGLERPPEIPRHNGG
ncbi:MAG TPA: hypothetical protein VG367_11520 [Mucilaginibacter sp.]|jgi:hypothetical protein|nr:hypothetical protein [Mucilaginibacter sp.]